MINKKFTPVPYEINLASLDNNVILEAIAEVLHHPDYKKLVEKRNKLVKASDKSFSQSQLNGMLNNIKKCDRDIADMIYNNLAESDVTLSNRHYEQVSLSQLLKENIDYSQEGMRERVEKFSFNVDKVVFLADMFETVINDIGADLRYIFKGEVEFRQFDGVNAVMKQLVGFFDETRKYSNDDDRNLYCEYSDSINAYLEKRLKTYTQKYRKLHPWQISISDSHTPDASSTATGT